MQKVYLVVIVHQAGSVQVISVHGTLEGAENSADLLRGANAKAQADLRFDFCYVVERPFQP